MITCLGFMSSGNPFIVIGLSGENMTRLMADEPIVLNLAKFGPGLPQIGILIVGGRTEDVILAQLTKEGFLKKHV